MKLIQKKKSFCLVMIFFILVMFVAPLVTFGIAPPNPEEENTTYHPLVDLPFIDKGDSSLKGYLEGIFKLLLSLSILFAVIMVTLGGVLYMTTDAIGGKAEGKDMIRRALLGLLLALVSWIILNTINPDLLTLDISPGGSAKEEAPADGP
jgi:hypothetical protein